MKKMKKNSKLRLFACIVWAIPGAKRKFKFKNSLGKEQGLLVPAACNTWEVCLV